MNRRPRKWQRVLFALLLVLVATLALASEQDQRRILIGLKLFPAVLAADADIRNKASSDGTLPLLLLYRTDRAGAERLAQRLSALEGIHGLRFAPQVAAYSDLANYANRSLAGIFLTEQSRSNLEAVIALARERRAIAFSPFEDDVEHGILSGLFVSDRILPYLNMEALRLSGITLKPFFIEVAKHYE